MAPDFINIIERKLINQLRDDFPGCHVFGQYPDAVDISYPAIIVEISTSGLFDKFMEKNYHLTGKIKGVNWWG